MNEMSGNIEQVRNALADITGVAPAKPVEAPDRYLVMARMNHELETVDSLRRNNVRAYWPSYEELMPTKARSNGFRSRRMRRVGIIPGYVFSVFEDCDITGLLQRIVGAIDIARTFSGNPLLVADADIQIIRRIEIGLNTPQPPQKSDHSFKVGEKVHFVDDLLGRWPPGRIIKLANDGRIGVEVELMGRHLTIWVMPFQIERM